MESESHHDLDRQTMSNCPESVKRHETILSLHYMELCAQNNINPNELQIPARVSGVFYKAHLEFMIDRIIAEKKLQESKERRNQQGQGENPNMETALAGKRPRSLPSDASDLTPKRLCEEDLFKSE